VLREAAADEREESASVPSAGTPPVTSSREETAVVELEGAREKSASVPSVAAWGAALDKHEAKPSSSRRSSAPTALACSAKPVCTGAHSLHFTPRRPLPPYGAIEVPVAVRAFVGVLGLVHGTSGCEVCNEQAGQVMSDLSGSCVLVVAKD
jgi:hypothetical protein